MDDDFEKKKTSFQQKTDEWYIYAGCCVEGNHLLRPGLPPLVQYDYAIIRCCCLNVGGPAMGR